MALPEKKQDVTDTRLATMTLPASGRRSQSNPGCCA
jgi:hypothetical protein